MLKTSSQLIFILIKDERGYGMLGERNAFEQKGKEDETLQRSIGKYLYWRSQKVFPEPQHNNCRVVISSGLY